MLRWGGVLMQGPVEIQYAYCATCDKIYQDDVQYQGSVSCPSCRLVVVCGLSKEEALKRLDEDQKELLR